MAARSYSVTQINNYIKQVISRESVLRGISIEGEVSNYKPHPTGHLYFTLKDDGSQMKVVMWASDRMEEPKDMKDGQRVVVMGDVVVYDKGGYYQLMAKRITLAGLGQLYEKFEQQKRKLEQEGLFNPAHKCPIPPHPKTIGIVTARQGAALQDICNTLKRRNPYVQPILCPAQVQGERAAESICRAIDRLEALGVDVILVARGGGSIEDLWAFNEERVVRRVYDCTIPVISGVGHQTDTTLIDFVSDLRAITPSAAAELCVREARETDERLTEAHIVLTQTMMELLNRKKELLTNASRLLQMQKPENRLEQKKEQVARAAERLTKAMERTVIGYRHQVELFAGKLHGLSPLQKISRGYGYIVDRNQAPVEHVGQVAAGEPITIYVSDGKITAQVVETEEQPREDKEETT